MKYFLINNNFHLRDVLERVEQFQLVDVTLICVPHTLEVEEVEKYKLKHYIFNSPLTEKLGWLKITKFLKSILNVKRSLCLNSMDELYIYTEYELLNHFIVNQFVNVKAKVNLIEENGLATYALNKVACNNNLNYLMVRHPKFFLAQLFYSGIFTKCYVSGQEVFPILPDNTYSQVIYYSDVSCQRKFKPIVERWKFKRQNNLMPVDPNGLAVLFLSQDVYNFYMTVEEYLSYLTSVDNDILSNYEKVFFKFHPREVGTDIEANVRRLFPSFTYVESNSPVEMLVDSINPELVVSFFSSALINLHRSGWHIQYTLSKWKGLEHNELLLAIKESLNEIGIDA
ncbi:polysialyltransferase family glycosyltransferase [Pseudoalteromonas sp. APC 3213]|uniref:polysialyltransferase family glycosyltransferase n=1 Tax=Pseudoalteromonas sp. APC 3213 TaxID=3035178 RepID=UPI0025B552DE|nr:polysialyltransferase family glycosyltransferase [Pseudoalteromonas sp. APC 3213]MDN3401230.1 polysialyltransferase family glycosyltransferase [Pseudoalteromonas sp. APC 3213]